MVELSWDYRVENNHCWLNSPFSCRPQICFHPLKNVCFLWSSKHDLYVIYYYLLVLFSCLRSFLNVFVFYIIPMLNLWYLLLFWYVTNTLIVMIKKTSSWSRLLTSISTHNWLVTRMWEKKKKSQDRLPNAFRLFLHGVLSKPFEWMHYMETEKSCCATVTANFMKLSFQCLSFLVERQVSTEREGK